MRLVWAIGIVLGAAALAPATASAMTWHERPQALWCAVYTWGLGGTRWECVYPTLESCVPTILAGTRGFCNPNPRYQAPEPHKWRRRKH
jgi:hypothetical protein